MLTDCCVIYFQAFHLPQMQAKRQDFLTRYWSYRSLRPESILFCSYQQPCQPQAASSSCLNNTPLPLVFLQFTSVILSQCINSQAGQLHQSVKPRTRPISPENVIYIDARRESLNQCRHPHVLTKLQQEAEDIKEYL